MSKIIARFGLPLFALACFGFALFSVLSSPDRKSSAPLFEPPKSSYANSVAGIGIIEPKSETIALGTHISGIVSKIYVHVGDTVKAGDPLFAIDDRDTQASAQVAKAALNSARVQAADASDLFERFQKIKGSTGISDSELARRRFAAELARTKVGEAEAQVSRIETDLDRLTVKAPVGGEILRVNIRPGEFAPTGVLAKPLMEMGDMTRLRVRVEFDQADIHRIQLDAQAMGSLRGSAEQKVELMFVRAEPLVQPKRSLLGDGTDRVDTRILEVIYEFDPEKLRAYVGQQMDVFVQSKPSAEQKTVSGDAGKAVLR